MAGTAEVAARAVRDARGDRPALGRAVRTEATMATTETRTGTAAVQGELWGARARDWAEVQEPAQREMYPPVLDAAGVRAGTRLLDAGCGSGVAAEVARGRGAIVSGIDASAPSIEIARTRVPDGDFRAGELEELPYAAATFDAVTGFNSFQYAGDPVRAVAEARRVTRPGGTVAIVTWGRAEDCEAAGMLKALASFLPAPPPGAPGPFALSVPGALEELAAQAGLTPVAAGDVSTRWDYPDLATALRGMLAGGPAVRAIAAAGEEAVAAAVAGAIAPYAAAAGGYRLENSWRYLIATA